MSTSPATAPLSHQRIIDAAFRAWGRKLFHDTSLSLVARELEITKPALYRYFSNKDALIAALDSDYASRVAELILDPIARSNPADFDALIPTYASASLRFYDKHPYHLAFLTGSIMARAFELVPALRGMVEKHAHLFTLGARAYPNLTEAQLRRVQRYVWSIVVHRCAQRFNFAVLAGSSAEFKPEEMPVGTAELKRAADDAAACCLHGFLPNAFESIELKLVEKIAWIQPEEVPEPDRILSAIERVVSRDGYARATVERIAAEVGITKSSLYFFFKNKDDMFRQYLMREQQRFAAAARIRMNQLSSPAEKLYALFVMIGGFAANNPVQTTVRNWLRYNNVEVRLTQEQIEEGMAVLSFLADMLREGSLFGRNYDSTGMLILINFLVMHEEMLLDRSGASKDEHLAAIRALFELFARGVTAVPATSGPELPLAHHPFTSWKQTPGSATADKQSESGKEIVK